MITGTSGASEASDTGGASGVGCALERLADRLLDWFSVLMADARAAPPPPDGTYTRTNTHTMLDCISVLMTSARATLRPPDSTHTDILLH